MESPEPIHTPVGVIAGRNAIYLDELCRRDRLTAKGQITSSLCSEAAGYGYWIDYGITFEFALCLRMTELDLYRGELPSSFGWIRGSRWIEELRAVEDDEKLTDRHRHFVLATYDDVIEVIATGYEFEVRDAQAAKEGQT